MAGNAGWSGGGTFGGSNKMSASQRRPISIACFIAARPDIEWKMPADFAGPNASVTPCQTRSRSRLNCA